MNQPYRISCPPSSGPRLPNVTRPSGVVRSFVRRQGDKLFFGCVLTLAFIAVACTKQEAKTAADLSVKIADDVCKETVDAGVAPDWMVLACDTASGVVKVLLPRTEGRAILARKSSSTDAGPGK